MDRSFEYKILAYLDGMLDARSEREFLKETARDPAKQRLLQQYRHLDSRLRDKSHPVAVPLRSQQALANSIPALKGAIPETVLPLQPSSTGTGMIAWLSRRVISLAAISGLLIGTLAFIALIPSNDDTSGVSESAVVSESDRVSEPVAATERSHNESMGDNSPISDALLEKTAPSLKNQPTQYSRIPGNNGHVRTGGRISRATGTDAGLRQVAEAIPTRTSLKINSAVPGERTGQQTVQTVEASWNESLAPVVFITRHEPVRSDGDHLHTFGSQFPIELFAGRLRLYIETGAAQFGASGTGNAETNGITGVYLAGLRFELTPSFAAGLEFGQSRFARERLESRRIPLSAGTGGEVIVIDRAMNSEMQPWMRLHALYTFNPDARFRVEADAGSGLLLNAERAVVFSSGLSAVYSLSTTLQARAGLHYSGTWLSPSAPEPVIVQPGSGVIGIIRMADAAGEVYSSSVEFRIGFGIVLW
jgi:hypothetical protein